MADRQSQIDKLTARQVFYIKKITNIATLPETKKTNIAINRATKCVDYFVKIRHLEIQKKIVLSQPIPNYKNGCAMWGETGQEIITDSSGNKYLIKKPTLIK